jgi:hypothetical protein
MRISDRWLCCLLPLGLAACGDKAASDPFAGSSGGTTELVECAPAGQTAFERKCAIDRVQEPAGLTLTIRHPDGAFRRLLVTGDGRGVVAADGAEPATVSLAGGNIIEVAVAGDRYRLPATVKGADAAGAQ